MTIKKALLACACLAAVMAAKSLSGSAMHQRTPRAVVEDNGPRFVRFIPQPVKLTHLIERASIHPRISSSNLQEFEQHRGFKIVVSKTTNNLYLFKGEKLHKVYRHARSVYKGDKLIYGDKRTPEGIFKLDVPTREKKHGWQVWITMHAGERAQKDYIAAYGEAGRRAVEHFERKHGKISSDYDVKRFNARAALPGKPMWNGVGIHGGGNSYPWTHGCVALANQEAVELSNLLRASPQRGRGTPVLILP